MLYCKSSKFLKSLDEIDVDKRLVDLIGDVTADRLLLGIRNGNLMSSIISWAIPIDEDVNEDNTWLYLDMINDVKDTLKLQGYIRNDFDDVVMPERYFVENYAIPCGLVDREICQPYYYSNKVYETYSFEYDRLRIIMNILEEELDDEQFNAVRCDVMYADEWCSEEPKIIADARRYLTDNCKRLKQRFNVCWL